MSLPRLALVFLLASFMRQVTAATVIAGVEGALLENVQAYVRDEPACDAGEAVVRRYATELPSRLRPALEAFGYYRAEVTVERERRSADCWQLRASIEAGRPVLVRDVSLGVSGAAEDDPAIQGLIERFPLHEGSVLNHGDYQTFKNRMDALARQRGYLEARYAEERVDVYVEQSAADIRLRFDSGPRYRFGEVTFAVDALSDRVLHSFVGFEQGDDYDASLIARLQRELVASEYFNEVNVMPQLDDARDGRIPIRVEALPARPTSYSLGVGFSTDDGPRFRFSYEDRRRNTAGHQLQVDGLLAAVRQYATFDYRIPVGNPQRDWRSFRAGLSRQDIEAGVGESARLSVRRVRVRDTMTVTRFVDLLTERDDLGDRAFSSTLLLPGMSWARSDRDDLIRPREGHRLTLEAAVGLGSEVSLLSVDLRGKWITATPWDARVLVRGRLGTIFENGAFTDVPLSLRFFAGGDNSVRGYDYESLGPRNAEGELIGGNRLLEASVEYEQPVLEQWAVAVFVDAGNAFLDSGFDARRGAGIGARWFSPIGPVRVDIAWPLDGEDRSPELHISLGPDL